jgi:Domain of Unknown Function (DUF1080)
MDGFPVDRWAIEDGELRTVPGSGVDLIIRDTFGDFELEFEWRVAAAGNSGVIYRVVETTEPAWATGPEYQVLDDEQHPDGRDPTTSAAALYGLIASSPNKRLEPVGSFNRGRIVVRDGRVEHWLNDERMVSYDWDGSAIRELMAASKFAGFERFMAAESGHIAFQAPRRGGRVPEYPNPIAGSLTPVPRHPTIPAWPSTVPASPTAADRRGAARSSSWPARSWPSFSRWVSSSR